MLLKERCLHCGGVHSLATIPTSATSSWDNPSFNSMRSRPRTSTPLVSINKEECFNKATRSDVCSDNQMINPTFLSNVHKVKNHLHLQTNARVASTNLKGYLGNTLFWLDQMGIANVVSLCTLESKYKITYDSEEDGGAFVVHMPDGKVLIQWCPKTSFPFIDLQLSLGERRS